MIVAPVAIALVLAQAPAWVEPPPSPPRPAAAPVQPEPVTATPTPTAPLVPPTPPPAAPPPPPPSGLPPPPGVAPAAAPSTRYLELSLGGSAPVGPTAAGVKQGDVYSAMVELELQLGKKLGEYTVAGAYAGFGIGGVGTRAQRLCRAAEKDDCATMMVRAGPFLRAATLRERGSELWALLGVGARLDSADVPDRHGTEHARLAGGPEARVSVGIDFPPSRPAPLGEALGIGLYLDATAFQALGSDAIPELGVRGGRRPLVGWLGGGLRLVQR